MPLATLEFIMIAAFVLTWVMIGVILATPARRSGTPPLQRRNHNIHGAAKNQPPHHSLKLQDRTPEAASIADTSPAPFSGTHAE